LGASPLLSSGLEWLEGEEEALLAAEGEGEDDLFLTLNAINIIHFFSLSLINIISRPPH
jgi:hypothetical protein